MALHRRAYTWILSGAKRTHWYEHMESICLAYADHPCYQALRGQTATWDRIWDAARDAVEAKTCPKLAFPLTIEGL